MKRSLYIVPAKTLRVAMRKLQFLLKSGDLVGYRVLLNHQPLFLRGFNVEAVYDFIPGYDKGLSLEKDAASLVSKFFYHNGFSKIHEVDKVGWSPLHYAGCRGDPQLVRALLELRANPNVRAGKDCVMAGALPKWRVMTSVAACRHHEVAHILIEAKADLSGTQLVGACIGNDPEGIRILCEVGGVSPLAADHEGGHGVLAVHLACMYGATAALEELLAQAERGKQSVAGWWFQMFYIPNFFTIFIHIPLLFHHYSRFSRKFSYHFPYFPNFSTTSPDLGS